MLYVTSNDDTSFSTWKAPFFNIFFKFVQEYFFSFLNKCFTSSPPPRYNWCLNAVKGALSIFGVGSLFSWEMQEQCNTTVILVNVNKKIHDRGLSPHQPPPFQITFAVSLFRCFLGVFLLNEGFIGGLCEWSEWCDYTVCAGPQPNGSQLSGRDEVTTQQRHPHFFQPQVGLCGPFILEFCARVYVQPVLSWGCLYAVVMLLSDSSVPCSLLYYTFFGCLCRVQGLEQGVQSTSAFFFLFFFFLCWSRFYYAMMDDDESGNWWCHGVPLQHETTQQSHKPHLCPVFPNVNVTQELWHLQCWSVKESNHGDVVTAFLMGP